jgi:hypothetical protein
LRLDKEEAKKAMVNLEAPGLATLNKDAALTPMTFGKNGMEFGPSVVCHVIFQAKQSPRRTSTDPT